MNPVPASLLSWDTLDKVGFAMTHMPEWANLTCDGAVLGYAILQVAIYVPTLPFPEVGFDDNRSRWARRIIDFHHLHVYIGTPGGQVVWNSVAKEWLGTWNPHAPLWRRRVQLICLLDQLNLLPECP